MPSKFLLSPSESKLAEKLGDDAITSSLPEQKGADILLYTDSGLFGWQRKQIPHDFISSVIDGRFARLLPLITKSCVFYRLINEGRFKFWPDQTVHLGLTKGHKRIPCKFTKKHIHGILNDIDIIWDVPVRWTEDLDDTVMYLKSIRDFMSSKRHTGLFARPKVKGAWQVPTSRDIELWLLQGFPGIGAATADAIIKHFGGEIPLSWNCTFDELCQVQGLTRRKAVELWTTLPSSAHIPVADADLKPQQRTEFASLRRRLGHGV